MNTEFPRRLTARADFTIETRRSRDAVRPFVCFVFLVLQVAVLAYHRHTADRWNRLTPFAGQTSYRLAGMMNQQVITADELSNRYGLAPRGTTAASPNELRELLRLREMDTPADNEVYLRLHTRRNGGEEEIWLWPQH